MLGFEFMGNFFDVPIILFVTLLWLGYFYLCSSNFEKWNESLKYRHKLLFIIFKHKIYANKTVLHAIWNPFLFWLLVSFLSVLRYFSPVFNFLLFDSIQAIFPLPPYFSFTHFSSFHNFLDFWPTFIYSFLIHVLSEVLFIVTTTSWFFGWLTVIRAIFLTLHLFDLSNHHCI